MFFNHPLKHNYSDILQRDVEMPANESYSPAPFNLPVSPGQMKIILVLLDVYKFKPKRMFDPKRHLKSDHARSSLGLKELPGNNWLQLRQKQKLRLLT